MKIGIVAFSGFSPIHIGGPSECAFHLARELAKLGDDVTVFVRVCNNDELKLVNGNFFGNIRLVPIVLAYASAHCQSIPSLLTTFINTSYKFTRTIKDLDLIHYNSPPTDISFLFPYIAKSREIPQVYYLHGGLFLENKRIEDRVQKGLLMIQRRLFDKVVVASEYMRDLATKEGFDTRKLAIIPNGVCIESYANASPLSLVGNPKILFVGRMVKAKGVHVLLRAFRKILEKYPCAYLYLVGEGPDLIQFKKTCRALGLVRNVRFTGFVNRELLPSFYSSSDLCVFPSIYEEPFGIVVLEAMAAHKVVVASKVGGMKEIINNGIDGVLTDPNNSDDLAEKIGTLLSDKRLFDSIAETGYEKVKRNYSWEKVSIEFRNLFISIMEERLSKMKAE